MRRRVPSPKAHDPGRGATTPALFAVHAASALAARLEVTVEREAGAEVARTTVLEGDVLRLGSHEANEVVLSDPCVSRFHSRLEREKDTWHVIDQGSLNGTWLAGVRVRDASLPFPECRIELGESTVRIRCLAAGGPVSLSPHAQLGSMQGKSPAMRRLFALVERVAKSDANVLIEGESGTGKELVATEIAQRGRRAEGPFVIIDCGAIAPSLVESSIFGHARGAFTGADRDRVGAFEAADGGTVFLDEIGEMPLDIQPRLLRVLESREVCRVGETKSRPVDVRIIAATNRRLETEVNHGRFREDLFFRLSVVTVRIPPLRDRLEDLEILVTSILESLRSRNARGLFTREALDRMAQYDWPGNVRELRNSIERAIVMRSVEASPDTPADTEPAVVLSRVVAPVDLGVPLTLAKEQLVADFEKKYVAALLDSTGGNVARAARNAGVDRINLHRIIQKHGLRGSRTMKE